LGFFIDTDHDRVLGWVELETDDVADLRFQLRAVLKLNVSTRCGWMFHLRQILATEANEMPSSAASTHADQCVIPSRCGGRPSLASVATTTSI
jgi:hypothetical protein